MENIFYERRVYELVDDNGISFDIFKKNRRKTEFTQHRLICLGFLNFSKLSVKQESVDLAS